MRDQLLLLIAENDAERRAANAVFLQRDQELRGQLVALDRNTAVEGPPALVELEHSDLNEIAISDLSDAELELLTKPGARPAIVAEAPFAPRDVSALGKAFHLSAVEPSEPTCD